MKSLLTMILTLALCVPCLGAGPLGLFGEGGMLSRHKSSYASTNRNVMVQSTSSYGSSGGVASAGSSGGNSFSGYRSYQPVRQIFNRDDCPNCQLTGVRVFNVETLADVDAQYGRGPVTLPDGTKLSRALTVKPEPTLADEYRTKEPGEGKLNAIPASLKTKKCDNPKCDCENCDCDPCLCGQTVKVTYKHRKIDAIICDEQEILIAGL